MSEPCDFIRLPSPVGTLTITAAGAAVISICFGEPTPQVSPPDGCIHRHTPFLDSVCTELDAWFSGRLRRFTVPVRLTGTPFQLTVWEAITGIPYGEHRSYGEIARTIGRPGAARAVGGACNRNPIPLIIPCHRVLGANGSLTGFAGGIPVKQRLLALEAGFS